MSQGNQSCLRFSLEESVWFQKGQEVLDLISISLNPDIFIQENDQYVTIQGALQLSGEYKRNEIGTPEDENSFAAPKFIQVVEERGEGVCEFTHFFPVDITIPNNRIQSINDIDVQVESFDYVFPERSCMKLSANLMIIGLYGEQQHTPVVEAEDEVELEPLYRSSAAAVQTAENPFDQPDVEEEERTEIPFAEKKELEPLYRPLAVAKTENPFELPSEEEVDEEDEERTEIYLVEEEEVEPINIFSNAAVKEEQDNERAEVPVLEKEEKEEIYAPFEAEARKQPETGVKEQEVRAETPAENKPEIIFTAQRSEEPSQPPPAAEIFDIPEESPIDEVEVVEIEIPAQPVKLKSSSKKKDDSDDKDEKQNKKSKKKSMSLTEFFARKEETEDVAKLKVCIVQNGDTVDIIAERYDIGVHHLLSVNHLEINQDVYEGQVLYIPVAAARQK